MREAEALPALGASLLSSAMIVTRSSGSPSVSAAIWRRIEMRPLANIRRADAHDCAFQVRLPE